MHVIGAHAFGGGVFVFLPLISGAGGACTGATNVLKSGGGAEGVYSDTTYVPGARTSGGGAAVLLSPISGAGGVVSGITDIVNIGGDFFVLLTTVSGAGGAIFLDATNVSGGGAFYVVLGVVNAHTFDGDVFVILSPISGAVGVISGATNSNIVVLLTSVSGGIVAVVIINFGASCGSVLAHKAISATLRTFSSVPSVSPGVKSVFDASSGAAVYISATSEVLGAASGAIRASLGIIVVVALGDASGFTGVTFGVILVFGS